MYLSELLKVARTSNPETTLEVLALEALKAGKVLKLGNRTLKHALEVLTLPQLHLVQVEGLDALSVKSAASHQAAGFFFQDRDPSVQVECPRCATRMKRVKLAEKQLAVFCPQCRHCDFDESEKAHINAGNPSIEKHLELVCKDAGHCEIKR